MRFGKKGIGAVASITAAAALLTCLVPVALADNGGGGSGEGGGGDHGGPSQTADVHWIYKDSWPATLDGMKSALRDANVTLSSDLSDGANEYVDMNKTLSDAIDECRRSYTGEGNADCRMVAVGYARLGNGLFNGSYVSSNAKNRWEAQWRAEAKGDYTYQGQKYSTSTTWKDKLGTRSVDSLAQESINSNPNASFRVIVLAQNQPPVDYKLNVTTSHKQKTDMQVGSTDPVGDVIHADNGGSAIKETLNGTAIIHYENGPYLPAKSVSKPISFSSNGDTQLDDLASPKDFGMKYWAEGSYWIDIQVPKQGRMQAAVDTADRDPAESWKVSSVPPEPPVKKIEDGVSADRMTNRTTITYGTGRGGYEMRFRDVIEPNGVEYSVDNYRLIDRTDDNRDVSGEFEITWDKASNTVSAARSADKGEMPMDHVYEFSFDVTVSKPSDFQQVKDHAWGQWNHEPEADAGKKQFDTWRPNPDKSWIRLNAKGQWEAVIDPKETNRTGADDMTLLDGDRVASVVNGTIAKNLIQAPETLTLTDDWSAADYLFDADDKSKIRVYEADAGTDRESSVTDIANHGRDVTDQWTITMEGTTVTATAGQTYREGLKGLKTAKQVTLLIPGKAAYANGKGTGQVRDDFGKQSSDELSFCTEPDGKALTNKGSQSVNTHTIPTNEPKICGYIPPVVKDVVGESSQGGDQASVDGKVVYPGQRVEYRLETQPHLPGNLAYPVGEVAVTDTYDEHLEVDKQTLEVTDLSTGRFIPKTEYETQWNDAQHAVRLVFSDGYVKTNWRNGANPRIIVRFEGTVAKDAPTDTKIGNQWALTLNNMITPSNKVWNEPPDFTPVKKDTQADPSISIDGKTALLGDRIYYRVTIDAKQTNQAYKVWRLGMTDDWDDEYLSLDAKHIEVTDTATGKDVTAKFNIAAIDGAAYVYARTADTKVPATGEIIKGDPQPRNLKEYAEKKTHDPLKEPAIDQSMLGTSYEVSLPMTVIKVTDGHIVKNKATQVVNDTRKDTNEVANPLKPVNPSKDVVVKVDGESIDKHSVYLNSLFLYRLDSSVLPAHRAYQKVTDWSITDPLDTEHDQYTGQWAVYAMRDLTEQGKVIARRGVKIAGSGFDAGMYGGELFTLAQDDKGVVTVTATQRMLDLVSGNDENEQAWTAFIQCKRVKTGEHIANRFDETLNGTSRPSNQVETHTPDMTPSLKIEKWDEASGWPTGDRDQVKDALAMQGDTRIVFTITNTSTTDPDTKQGAWYRTKDLNLKDQLVAGDGQVTDLEYPADWDTHILKPGESIEVRGVLKGVTDHHTDRVTVTGTPLVECVVSDPDPFDGKDETSTPDNAVTIDGMLVCPDTEVVSNTDDWNGYRTGLAHTGTAIQGVIAAAITLLAAGVGLVAARRFRRGNNAAGRHSGTTQPVDAEDADADAVETADSVPGGQSVV